jgi:hypothetical protein
VLSSDFFLIVRPDTHQAINIDELVKSRFIPFSVIPAEDGIQSFQSVMDQGVRRGDDKKDFLRLHRYLRFDLVDQKNKMTCATRMVVVLPILNPMEAMRWPTFTGRSTRRRRQTLFSSK